MSTISRTTTVKIEGSSEKEIQDKSSALHVLAKNLNRDSLVILANKSSKPGVNDKIRQYQSIM